MNKKFLLYFLTVSLLNPYPLVYAGGVFCKAKAKLPALEQAVADLAQAVAYARSWQKWENAIFYSALNTALFKGFIVLECYKKENAEPVSMVQDLITHGPAVYTLFEDIYAIAGNTIGLGSVQEMIYKLFVTERAENDEATTEALAELVLHRRTIKEPKVTYDVFLATRAAEFIKQDIERKKNEERNKAFAKKQKEEASFWNDLIGNSVHNKRINKMDEIAGKLRLSIAACQECRRNKAFTADKIKFNTHLRSAFQEIFEILRIVDAIDPAVLQPFIDSLKQSTQKAAKKVKVPVTLYTLFEQVFNLSKDEINPRNVDELLGVLAQIKPEYVPLRPLQDVLSIALGFRAKKKQTIEQNEEIQRALDAKEKGTTEAQLKEKKALEEEMLAKIKELELRKKAEEEQKKLEEQQKAERKAKEDQDVQAAAELQALKAQLDKVAAEKAKSDARKKTKDDRKKKEAAALKEIEKQARLRQEKATAKEAARFAKQQKDEAEKQKRDDELKALAAQQAAVLRKEIADKKAKKESELEIFAQQFQQRSKSRRLRNAFIKWQNNTAKPLAIADAFNTKRSQKHTFELWKKEFQNRKRIKEERIAQEKAQKQLQEQAQKKAQENLERGLQKHFAKHTVKKAPDYLHPLLEAERVVVDHNARYKEWFNDHLDGLIFSAATNYLHDKSMFPTNRPKFKIHCALCEPLIDKALLEHCIKKMHWSDFARSPEYQLVNQQLRTQAFSTCAVQQQL